MESIDESNLTVFINMVNEEIDLSDCFCLHDVFKQQLLTQSAS